MTPEGTESTSQRTQHGFDARVAHVVPQGNAAQAFDERRVYARVLTYLMSRHDEVCGCSPPALPSATSQNRDNDGSDGKFTINGTSVDPQTVSGAPPGPAFHKGLKSGGADVQASITDAVAWLRQTLAKKVATNYASPGMMILAIDVGHLGHLAAPR